MDKTEKKFELNFSDKANFLQQLKSQGFKVDKNYIESFEKIYRSLRAGMYLEVIRLDVVKETEKKIVAAISKHLTNQKN